MILIILFPPEPRHRAPLGTKTTNAKAQRTQTPAPPVETVKRDQNQTSRRTSTAQRIRKAAAPSIKQPYTDAHDKTVKDDVPEVEYMPPKPKGSGYFILINSLQTNYRAELADIPDEITYDTTFPQFQPRNMALGLESVYGDNEVGSDGLTKKERKFREDSIAYDRMVDETTLKQITSMNLSDFNESDGLTESTTSDGLRERGNDDKSRMTKLQSRPTSGTSTIQARNAAAALSGSSSARVKPSSMIRQQRPRVTSVFPSQKPRDRGNPPDMAHSAAVARSRSTLGYSKGRNVSSAMNQRAPRMKKQVNSSSQNISPESYVDLYGPPPLGSEMWIRCKAVGCFDEVNGQDNVNEENLPTLEEDEEAQNFQLTL